MSRPGRPSHARAGNPMTPAAYALPMSLHERLERAKRLTVLGAKTGALVVGVAATVGVLGLMWTLLHEAEDEALLALLGEDGAE